jgi:uncharacterized protein YecE (DUF72 family)
VPTPLDSPDRPIRIGCSGWNYAHWRNGVFYPPRLASKDWLRFYAEQFDTVEVNTTFYRLPRFSSVARWVEESPAGFTFAVKVSRYVTHIKRLLDVPQHLPLLYERIAPLLRSPKLGPLLWQLPPTFSSTSTGSRVRSSICTTDIAMRSSSDTRRGSARRSTRSCVSIASRS